jgi:hypothetical protein
MEEKKPTEFALREQRDLKLAEIQKELNAGRKINAIKIFRETFGTGLKDAKEAVEALQWGENLDISNKTLRENYSALQESPVEQKIYQNVGQGNTNPGRAGAVIFWFLVALGIAFFMIFGGD